MRPQLPTASDLAILAGALWESLPARAARAAITMAPAIAAIVVLAMVTAVEDHIRARPEC